jgi:hypothetical protein
VARERREVVIPPEGLRKSTQSSEASRVRAGILSLWTEHALWVSRATFGLSGRRLPGRSGPA